MYMLKVHRNSHIRYLIRFEGQIIFCGKSRSCIRQQHDISHGICSQRLPSILFAGKRVLDSELIHRCECFQRSVLHRLAWSRRRGIEITQANLHPGLPSVSWFIVGNVTFRGFYRMQCCPLVFAANRVLADGVAPKEPIAVGYGSERAIG